MSYHDISLPQAFDEIEQSEASCSYVPVAETGDPLGAMRGVLLSALLGAVLWTAIGFPLAYFFG